MSSPALRLFRPAVGRGSPLDALNLADPIISLVTRDSRAASFSWLPFAHMRRDRSSTIVRLLAVTGV